MGGMDDRVTGLFSYVRLEDGIAAEHPLRAIRLLVEEVFERQIRNCDAVRRLSSGYRRPPDKWPCRLTTFANRARLFPAALQRNARSYETETGEQDDTDYGVDADEPRRKGPDPYAGICHVTSYCLFANLNWFKGSQYHGRHISPHRF